MVQVLKFLHLHVNQQVKVFYRLAVVFSCSCLPLISWLFLCSLFSLTEAESFVLRIVTVQFSLTELTEINGYVNTTYLNGYQQEVKTVTCYSKARFKHHISHVPNLKVLNA